MQQRHSGHFSDTIWRQFFQSPAKACALLGIVLVLLLGTLVSTRLLNSIERPMTKKSRDRREYPLNCSGGSKTNTNPGTYPTSYTTKDEDHNGPAPSTCPDYFRWIHKDLRPWVHTGITREMIERGREPGYFRLRLKKSFQSRDTFTLWGILQLLSSFWFLTNLIFIAMHGNHEVSWHRKELMKCNVSEGQDWSARLYSQNWNIEQRKASSNLTWPANVKTGLIPMHHYWPIMENDKCRSIKFAVDWGNNHTETAQGLGKAASKFVQEELKLDNVYDYMFHLLNHYSKLLRYQPTIPPKADEYCAETLGCPEEGLARKFMEESFVKSPKETSPCTLPPPYDPISLHDVLWGEKNQYYR
ncbi:CAP10 domain-containing protein [Citrus sinensis]|nr:CAP10 domain-containing protein [Citrus sinensis]